MKVERVHFVTVPEVLAVHDAMIEVGGGGDGVRSQSGLEAAVMAVQATYGGELLLATLADIAAGYAFYITTSHPFVDGNKRTALMTAITFLDVNGFPVIISKREEWNAIMVALARGSLTREKLAEFFAALMGEWGELE